MSKFKAGQRVRVVGMYMRGCVGTVLHTLGDAVQVSFSPSGRVICFVACELEAADE